MENSRVSLIHFYLSSAIAILCVLWLQENPNISIKLIILIQLISVVVSFFSDVSSRNKLINFFVQTDEKINTINSLDTVKPYLKILYIGTIVIVLSFGLAVIFIDYENNPNDLLLAVKIITVFLIWSAHNWYAVKLHKTKL